MRAALCLLLLPITGGALTAADAPPPEVEFLIGYIRGANVRFIRSGKEYTAQEGADHMRKKLARAGTRVKTAEDFITLIATKSHLTGEIYKVKLSNGKTVPTAPWLTDALGARRQAAKEK